MSRWLMILPAVLAGCGSKAVDLDGANTDPTVLATVREDVAQIAVADGRIYWLASDHPLSIDGGGPLTLRGCDAANCASSLVTFATQRAFGPPGLGLVGDEVYWFQFGGMQPDEINDGKTYLLASPAVGGGTPRIVSNHATTLATAFDDDAVYISGESEIDQTLSEIDAIPLPAGGEPRLVAALGDQGVIAMKPQGDYLYWIYGSWNSKCAIQRTRKDGSSAVETLAEDLEIGAPQTSLGPIGGLTVDATYFYWTDSTLSGALRRCRLSGCGGAPETLLAPLRSPTGIFLDGSALYFLHEQDAFSYAIASCATSQCVPSLPLLTGIDGTNVFAIDDRYLYSATTSQDLSRGSDGPSPVVELRRVPK